MPSVFLWCRAVIAALAAGAKARVATLAALVVAAALGCGGEGGPTQPEAPVVATVEVAPGTDTLTALGQTRQLTAVAKDASGNAITGKTIAWRSSAPAVATVDPATGLVTAVTNGAATITATADGKSGQAAVAVAQQVATVTVTPGSAALSAVGATQQFRAEAKDANGNVVSGVAFIWLSSDHGVATVSTTGLATARGPGDVTITAAGRGIPGTATLAVAQAAAQLAFTVQPTNATAGEALSPAMQVEIRDANGILVVSARDAVTLAIGTNAGDGKLAGTKTVNAVNGIATFGGLWIDKAGTGYTLVASSGSLTGATSSPFNISPAALAQLAFTTQPPATVEGNVVIAPAVQVTLRDAFGNLVPTGPVTIGIGSVPWPGPGSRVSGTLTVEAVSGVATFTDLRIDKPGRGYTLVATSGAVTEFSVPFTVRVTFTSVDVGGAAGDAGHSCGTATGGTYCWGNNFRGQLGDGTTRISSVPVLVTGGLSFVEVTAGSDHTCGRTSAGAAYCWGRGSEGELGNGGTAHSSVPVQVSGSGAGALIFSRVRAGGNYTCGATTSKAVYCWGNNADGQLGDGTTTASSTPVLVSGSGAGALLFSSVSAGGRHACGVATGNAVYCWGLGASGELGDGGNATSSTPVLVSGSGTTLLFSSVSAGSFHTCAVTTGAKAYCWGSNGSGALGDGTTIGRSTPTAVSPSLNFGSVTSGSDYTCGTVDFGAYCWGRNDLGQLGNGTRTNSNTPVPVVRNVGEFGVSSVRTAWSHTCAHDEFGAPRVICWGSNFIGELGDGSLIHSLVPVVVVQ